MSQFQSPFFMNLYFYLPSSENTSKNISHISYIGTRPGVDLGEKHHHLEAAYDEDPESFGSDPIDEVANSKSAASPEPSRRSASWLASYEDERQGKMSSNPSDLDSPAAHVKYAHERPRSHGLFSSDHVESVKSVQDELRNHKGVVWRTILSLNEVDAIRLGYEKRESWESMLKANVPLMAHEMGIPESNLRWVAAFHEEEGHPHVHLVLWEKEPKRKLGQLLPSERNAVRKTFIKEIYGQERVRLAQEKTVQRDLLRDIAKEDLVKAVELSRAIRSEQIDVELDMTAAGSQKSVGLAPKMYSETSKELGDQLNELADMMPKKGRIAYKYMPEEVKDKVDIVTDWVLRQPEQKKVLDQFLKAVDGMTRPYSFQENQIDEAKARAYEDIRKRIGQVVLKAASESQKNNFFEVDLEKAQIVIETLSEAVGIPEDPKEKVLKESIQQLRLLGLTKNEQFQCIHRWMESAELGLNPIELNRLVENEQNTPLNPDEFNPHAVATILNFTGMPAEGIREILLDRAELQPDEVESVLEQTKSDVQEASNPFMNDSDWNQFSRNVGVPDAPRPWLFKECSEILLEKMDLFLNGLKQASFHEDLSPRERNWTAFCITVALKQLGLEAGEREEIMREFAQRNEISGLGRILDDVENIETNFLRKPTWEKVMSNINSDNNQYPWITREEVVLDSSKLEEIVEQISSSQPAEMSDKEATWTAEKLGDLLKAIRPASEVREYLKEWASKVASLQEIPEVSDKRQGDLEVLSKRLGVKDMQHVIVSTFAKVLFAAGLAKEQVSKIIRDWNDRAHANIPRAKMDKIVQSTEKFCADLKAWGRVPYVSKKQFQQLNKVLGVNAPWMWKGNRELRKYERTASNNMAQGVWKAIWRGLEQERQKSQAKGEIIRRQLVREQTKRRQQSEEQER